MKQEKTYFDVGAYDNSSHESFRQDLVTLTLENGDEELEKRITPYEIKFNKLGEPNFNLSWDTEVERRENEALYKIRDLARQGKEYLLWISPPAGEMSYKESRMVVAIKKEENEGELTFDCRGICAKFDGQICLEIAEKLGTSLNDPEELRSTPIIFKVEDGESWIDALQKIIDIPKVWETIRSGEDKINKRQNEEVVEEIANYYLPQLRKDLSYRERLIIGAEIEMALEQRGVTLRSVGSCGMSNSEALKIGSAFDVVFNQSLVPGVRPEGYDYYCSVCSCWCKGSVCPICHLKLSK